MSDHGPSFKTVGACAPQDHLFAADAGFPGAEPATREQIKARRQAGAGRFFAALAAALGGNPRGAQHHLIECKGAFRRAAYEAEVLAMAEHREAAALDAREGIDA